MGSAGFATISKYGSVTGYAVVEQSITLDIMGSSNDENYTLSDVHQGETKYSPQIKIVNHADVPLNVSVTASVLPNSAGGAQDVNLSIVNENKNVTLSDSIEIPTSDLYLYVKHQFSPSAALGSYYFSVNATPGG